MSVIYSERTCPVCGTVFTPRHKRQIYDRPYCRTKASRQNRKDPEISLVIANHAAFIQRDYPMVADAMRQLFNKYGRQLDTEWTLLISNAIAEAEKRGRAARPVKRRAKK